MGGYSYQELKQQLDIAKEAIEFLLNVVSVPIQSPIAGPDGKHQVKVVPAAQLFLALKQAGAAKSGIAPIQQAEPASPPDSLISTEL